ncbi:MCE family protein [Planotetraspora sp. A-T 1434]|uniref:MCE family protein n=1 Tax=Planotetraspora sp. A-T 1434 TaxID=2979219 RepID=UPI0021C0D29F|nr:MCE family protein [Planotetraspora sp. A-T 1434]MCT9930492.1 MCE family protein [Planotetraspora sp. A-T 1434]
MNAKGPRPADTAPERPVKRRHPVNLGIAAALVLVLLTGGCSILRLTVVSRDAGPYRVVAYFAAAPSLYEQAKVKVLGVDAGRVDRIRVEGRRVRVEMTVIGEVPLPPGVKAAIAPQNTLGERSVVLYPPWKPGEARLRPGAIIPLERTDLPVEIDDALAAFTKLTDALDPGRVGAVAGDLATSLDGRGREINRALSGTAELTRTLSGQDEELIELAAGLRDLAASLNRREGQVRTAIDGFAGAAATLAEERVRIRRFIRGLAAFVRKGDVLVQAYQERLPGGVASVAELILTLKADSESVSRAISSASRFADVVIDSWDRTNHLMKIRVALSPMTRAWLRPLFDTLVLPGRLGEARCLPGPLANCDRSTR